MYKDKYQCFSHLQQHEIEGRDYTIQFWQGRTGVVILAPHGGTIEFGTTELARAIAGEEHGFYSFTGLKTDTPKDLHLTSHRFDEPQALNLVAQSQATVTVHGCREQREIVYLGGLDQGLIAHIARALEQQAFPVGFSPRYPGTHPDNICNRNRRKQGVQLEISWGLRTKFFQDLWTWEGRKNVTPCFHQFVAAVRQGIAYHLNSSFFIFR